MNRLQKYEIKLRSEILEHIADVYRSSAAGKKAKTARRKKHYADALKELHEAEHAIRTKKRELALKEALKPRKKAAKKRTTKKKGKK